MSEQGQQRQATLVPHPAGRRGTLTIVDGPQLPVQSYERGGEEVVLVLLTDSEAVSPGEVDPATLEYATVRGIVRLHGEAVFEPRSVVRFVAAGDAEVIQRRAFVRAHAPREIRLVREPAGPGVRVYTLDISGGGMLLASSPGLRVGDTVEFEIEVGDEQPPITGVAQVVRADGDGRPALAFERIEESDRQRLIHFVFSCLRESRAKTRGDLA